MLTDIQFTVAHKLSSHFGHEWAHTLSKDSPLRDPDEIAAATNAAREEFGMAGITAPYVEQVPSGETVVYHTTETGRLDWEVWPCGHVNASISRPAGQAFGFSVDPEEGFNVWKEDVPYAERHIEAAEKVLEALEVEDIWFLRQGLLPAPLETFVIQSERFPVSIDIPRGEIPEEEWIEAFALALLRSGKK